MQILLVLSQVDYKLKLTEDQLCSEVKVQSIIAHLKLTKDIIFIFLIEL